MRRELTWTGSAMNSLHMDPGRFLYDDGHTTICPTGVRKTQGVRRVGGRAATSQDAGSHTRQEDRGCAPLWRMNTITEVRKLQFATDRKR